MTAAPSRIERRPAEKMRLRVRLFHLVNLFWRPLTLGARAIVLDTTRREILLVRHTYVGGWHLPGGGVEPGETIETCLARELQEEGNIVLLGPAELKSIHLNRRASRRDHVAVYLVTNFRQDGPRKPDFEIAESRFFPLDALPDGTTDATRQRLAEILDGAPASAEW